MADLAGRLRSVGLRVDVYLGSSAKLGKQLKWANEAPARFTLLHGPQEQADGVVTVRDMRSGDQQPVGVERVAEHLRGQFLVRCPSSLVWEGRRFHWMATFEPLSQDER